MSDPVITRGSTGDAAALAQQLLNRNGGLLEEDGKFGPSSEAALKEFQAQAGLTVTGIVDADCWARLRALPEPCEGVATRALVFIAVEEVGSRADYDALYCRPDYPGGDSGITIGVGYDLRYEADSFIADWSPLLTAAQIGALKYCLAAQGNAVLVRALHGISIPWHAAWLVFINASVPKYLGQTATAFPNLDILSPLSRGALLSLVFNRGPQVTDSPGSDRRREMGQIRDAMERRQLAAIPAYLRSMQRLWAPGSDLYRRREHEAALFEAGLTDQT
jgi:hypothetical protein